MLSFGILATLLAVATADSCYKHVEEACGNTPTNNTDLASCTAKYGSTDINLELLKSYANAHIESSYTYLLMSSHFGTYVEQREGFKKLYRKYSDKTWEDAISLIKYVTKRGGTMDFNKASELKIHGSGVVDLHELQSLSKGLEIQKQLAEEANRIHSQAYIRDHYDAGIVHYIEEQFLESHTERVRDLAGHLRDLRNILGDTNPALSIFLFDEFLQKSL